MLCPDPRSHYMGFSPKTWLKEHSNTGNFGYLKKILLWMTARWPIPALTVQQPVFILTI